MNQQRSTFNHISDVLSRGHDPITHAHMLDPSSMSVVLVLVLVLDLALASVGDLPPGQLLMSVAAHLALRSRCRRCGDAECACCRFRP